MSGVICLVGDASVCQCDQCVRWGPAGIPVAPRCPPGGAYRKTETMITRCFRSYSVSYLRQETNFRDHRPDVVRVRCSRDSRDCRGPRGQLCWATAVPPECASREPSRTRETAAFPPVEVRILLRSTHLDISRPKCRNFRFRHFSHNSSRWLGSLQLGAQPAFRWAGNSGRSGHPSECPVLKAAQ
jgi:hypothetical protein